MLRAIVVTTFSNKNNKNSLDISGEASKQTFCGELTTESIVLNNTQGLFLLDETIFAIDVQEDVIT